jgi:hypothetical protein
MATNEEIIDKYFDRTMLTLDKVVHKTNGAEQQIKEMLELARADERAKVADKIFSELDRQDLIVWGGRGDRYKQFRERFLGKQKPEGEKR